VVLAVLQRWVPCGAAAGAYAIVTVARLILARRRAQVHVHDHGVVIERGGDARAWHWDELACATTFAIVARIGERLPNVTDEAAAALAERWGAHALARARAALAAGETVSFKDGALRVRASGIVQFGVLARWADARVELRDGFALVMATFEQSLAMARTGQRGSIGIAIHDRDLPEGPVFRALVREYKLGA